MSYLSPQPHPQCPQSPLIPPVAIGYLRVSTEQQAHGSGLVAQRAAVEAYAQAQGIVVEQVFEEHHTARDDTPLRERPEFVKALNLAMALKCPILVGSMDRVSRKPDRFLEFCQEGSIKIIPVCEIDSSSAASQAALIAKEGVVAAHRHERQAEAFQMRRAADEPLGNPSPSPLARQNSTKTRKQSASERVEKIAEVLKELGRNVRRQILVEELNRRGIRSQRGLEWNDRNVARDHREALKLLLPEAPVIVPTEEELEQRELEANPLFGMF